VIALGVAVSLLVATVFGPGPGLGPAAEGAPAAPAGDAESEKKKAASDDAARAALERFAAIVKSGDAGALPVAIEGLSDTPHPLVVTELAKQLAAKETTTKLAAPKALSKMDATLAGPVLTKEFKSKKNQENPRLYAAIVEAVGESGTPVGAKALLDLVPIDASREDPNVVKAAVVALGKMKEKKAVEPLIKIWEVDPHAQPASPSANDPPASYWKAVWERWQAVEPVLKQSLFEITGERFENGAQARDWYKKNKSRLKIP